MNEPSNIPAEFVSKLVFSRLNPVLRMLCEAVKLHNAMLKSLEQLVTGNKRSFLERKLGTLRTIADLLDELQTQLEALAGGKKEQQQYVSGAVLVMIDYVTLPLLAILRSFGEGWCRVGESSNNQTIIEQSAVWKCIERASRALQITVQISENETHSIAASKRLSYIAACVTALPSGAVIMTRCNKPRLDTGDDCLCSLLATLQTLVNASVDIRGIVQNGWMCRILDSCIALLEPGGANKLEASSRLQLTSVDTVCRLLEIVRGPDPWRAAFPGMYAGLYRRILASIRVSRAQPNAKQVVLRAMAALTHLLQCSLQRVKSSKQMQAGSSIIDQLQVLSSLTNSSASQSERNAVTETVHSIAALSPEELFYCEIHQRLPATLTVLVNMLTVARSSQVREQAVSLNRVLLIATRSCWEDDLMTACLESCLVLCRDSEKNVASEALSLVQDYSKAYGKDVSEVVAPRIIALVERLPSLAQSSREMELQVSLKLIAGYLTLCSKDAVKELRSSLSTESVSMSLRRTLATILEVHFDSFGPHQSGALVLTVEGGQYRPTRGPSLRYMQKSTAQDAYDMVHALGGALGPKHVAIFVDASIADLYRACVERVERRLSLEGHSQVCWVNEWIGAIKLAQEILVGGFALGVKAARNKNSKKRVRLLVSLAQSILPIITTYPLWDLPTSASVHALSLPPTIAGHELSNSEVVVSAALRGNATVSCELLELVRTFVDLLGDQMHRFTPMLLYPILEKAGQRNVGSVRDAALSVLQTLAIASGSYSISIMIADNMESSLMGTMLGRIRVPGGRTLSPNAGPGDSLLAVVDCATTVLRITTEAQSKRKETPHGRRSMLSYMEELTQELATRFDYVATNVPDDIETTIRFMQLFDAAILLLRASREKHGEASSRPPTMVAEPWFELLAPFKKVPEEHNMGPREGFELLRKEREEVPDEYDTKDSTIAGATRDTTFVAQIAWRCSYLLSQQSLKVQIQSCNVLVNCFTYLGWVASDMSAQCSEANGPKTAILRQIHSSWPAIGARLTATCSVVTIANGTSLVVVSQQPTTLMPANIGEQRVYLSKLLTLISAMTECADDFMATRFREIVWPCVGKILRSFSNQQRLRELSMYRRSSTSESSCRRWSRAESECSLLLATIQCLSRVFGHRPVGIALRGLIPSVGVLLFPFLDDENESIVSACTHTIRNLLRIDCDSLWRPLVEMSGQGIPDCPLKSLNQTDVKPLKRIASSERLVRITKGLLLFINSLPEQKLE